MKERIKKEWDNSLTKMIWDDLTPIGRSLFLLPSVLLGYLILIGLIVLYPIIWIMSRNCVEIKLTAFKHLFFKDPWE